MIVSLNFFVWKKGKIKKEIEFFSTTTFWTVCPDLDCLFAVDSGVSEFWKRTNTSPFPLPKLKAGWGGKCLHIVGMHCRTKAMRNNHNASRQLTLLEASHSVLCTARGSLLSSFDHTTSEGIRHACRFFHESCVVSLSRLLLNSSSLFRLQLF
ncbi:hypothetical protein FKM82_001411 [Ascaphus truei]